MLFAKLLVENNDKDEECCESILSGVHLILSLISLLDIVAMSHEIENRITTVDASLVLARLVSGFFRPIRYIRSIRSSFIDCLSYSINLR